MANFMHSVNRWIRLIITAVLLVLMLNAVLNYRAPYTTRMGLIFGTLLFIWVALCVIYENKEDFSERERWQKASKLMDATLEENHKLKVLNARLEKENQSLKDSLETLGEKFI